MRLNDRYELAGCDPKPREEMVRAVYCKCPEIPMLAR